MDTENTKKSWDDMMARLAKERDELALKMQLGQAEARAEWEKLEAKWAYLRTVKGPPMKEAAAETARGVGSALEQAAGELKKGYEKIRKLL
jgi:nitric oxide reductase activation protein